MHQGTKANKMASLKSANSSSIDVVDIRFLEIKYKDRTKAIPVYIAKRLNEQAIAGMDIINALGICYDPRSSSFISAIEGAERFQCLHSIKWRAAGDRVGGGGRRRRAGSGTS